MWIKEKTVALRYAVITGILCCVSVSMRGQLTSSDADGKDPTAYINSWRMARDTVFVFNDTIRKGSLSLSYRPASTITWEKEESDGTFSTYKIFPKTTQCTIDTLSAGEYRIIISNDVPEKDTVDCRVEVTGTEGNYTVTVSSDTLKFTKAYAGVAEPKGPFTVTADAPTSFYEWYQFDYATKNFKSTPFHTETETSSTRTQLESGGYKVRASAGAVRDSFVAWVYVNPAVELKLKKTGDGAVIYENKRCEGTYFPLEKPLPAAFVYYAPGNSREYRVEHLSFTVNSMSIALSGNRESQQFFWLEPPPYEPTSYAFSVTDRFKFKQGVVATDNIQYDPIVPHADISVMLPDVQPQSAPVYARFINLSRVNADTAAYIWRFGDDVTERYGWGEKLPHPDTVRHTYTLPKKYTVSMQVTNIYECQDSATLFVTVDPSKLDVGNVFSPNGDNRNDYFKPENTSIRQFEFSIYTRAGKRVYRYQGDDLRHWQGWNGRMDSGKDAAEGIYFFVLRAIGWDNTDYGWKDRKTNNDTYRSYVYLYR
ncbi:MAG: gliding motility-associated C-terminal domain-containing protein [Bacteroidales bacterium]|jgi:hypothetical protein|nr:gliding motility-associated C-terminal domain-containing protein [Bacteroidales bacterium]